MTPERRMVQLPTNTDATGAPTCPTCGCEDTEVTHTYPWTNGTRRRRRVCNHCGLPFHTIQPCERVDGDDRM